MFEQLRLLFQGKKKIIVGSSVVILLLIVASGFMINSSSQRSTLVAPKEKGNTTTSNNLVPTLQPKGALPIVKVGKWNHTDTPLPDGNSYISYSFKTTFPLSDVSTFASKFGFVSQAEVAGNNAFFGRTDAFLHFNTTNGSYTFYDKNGVTTGDPASPILQNVQQYIERLGVNDGTLRTVNTYRKRSQPGIMYFELHRDWVLAGAPILNQLGILNLPETTSLSGITQNTILNTAKDEDIYATNNGTDGYKRADDFNTMTLGVDESTQKILTMRSNIRPFLRQTAPSPIISYQKAVQLLQEGKATYIYTAPAGQGIVDWKKVYPSDIVEIQNAEVTQSVVAYLEDVPAQKQELLSPYFIFKGFAQSSSGYRIQFVASVDAVDHGSTPLSFLNKFIGQAWAQAPNSSGLKLGTFSFVTPSVTVAPTNPLAPTPTTPAASSECIPPESDVENISDWEGVQVGFYGGRWPLTPASQPPGYYMVPRGEGFGEIALGEWINRALERHEDQNFNTTPGGIRDLIDIVRDLVLNTNNCPIRLTGASPTLFAYSDIPSTYAIVPNTSITYADPALDDRKWEVIVHGDELTVKGIARPYLYYEYKKIDFDRPKEGWVIDKHDIPQFAKELGIQLGLHDREQERLQFELNHAASDIDTSTVFVGLLSKAEVEEKLPLDVKPDNIEVQRIHFYVGEVLEKDPKEPLIVPIYRLSRMVLEIGAAGYRAGN